MWQNWIFILLKWNNSNFLFFCSNYQDILRAGVMIFSHRIRKVWQRRKCSVKNGILTISHATVSTSLTRVILRDILILLNSLQNMLIFALKGCLVSFYYYLPIKCNIFKFDFFFKYSCSFQTVVYKQWSNTAAANLKILKG